MTEGRFYRPELDGLRFFAFLMVFIAHAAPDPAAWERRLGGPWTFLAAISAAGVYGVDLFFSLSAYLITTLLLREQERTGEIQAGRFYGRRALRIWPLYFVMLTLTPIFARLIPGEHLSKPYLEAFLLFAGNWACSWWGYPSSVVTPLWSVSIEEQFYVAWPWVIRYMKRSLPWFLIGLFAISAMVQFHFRHAPHPTVWCNTLARLQPIAVGAAIALIPSQRGSWIVFAIGTISFLICGGLGSTSGPAAVLTYPTIAIASGVLIFYAPTLTWAPLVYLGRISYGLYVFHALSLALVLRQDTVRSIPEYALRVIGSFVFTAAFAALSYRLLERPFLKFKDRIAVIHSRPI